MNTVTIILIIAIIACILWALYLRGKNKIMATIHTIEQILSDKTLNKYKRIEEAKYVCRNTKGIVFYGINIALSAISNALED